MIITALNALLPSWWKLAAIGIAVAAVIVAGVTIYNHIWNEGYETHVQEVAADNQAALTRIDELRTRARNCNAGGGMWSQARRQCEGRP